MFAILDFYLFIFSSVCTQGYHMARGQIKQNDMPRRFGWGGYRSTYQLFLTAMVEGVYHLETAEAR